jgi:hypothetical protein
MLNLFKLGGSRKSRRSQKNKKSRKSRQSRRKLKGGVGTTRGMPEMSRRV